MVTYKTLEVYLAKCETVLENLDVAMKELEISIAEQQEELSNHRDRAIAAKAQRELTMELMDIDNNPPIVELPFAEDKIEEMFDARLEGPDGLTEEEVKEDRQEMTYLREALQAVEDIDATNTEGFGAGEDA
jgi:phage shock protein A